MDWNKYDNPNPVIREYILKSGLNSKILDVGCWTGTLGRTLEKSGLDFEIDGLDIDKQALLLAKKESVYRNLYRADLNEFLPADVKNGYYELIVLGDVLEHTVDPQAVIKKILPKLTENGRILVSLPNVGFIKYRWLHLLGKWRYTDAGVMDKTHLRFFTFHSARELFLESGLRIVDFKPLNAVNKIYKPLDFLAKLWPNLFALQMIFELKRSSNVMPGAS